MTIQELHNYIDRTLGNNVRCLLSSFWWKKLFHLVVDKVESVEQKIDNVNLPKEDNKFLEIRYNFGTIELSDEDKAVNAATYAKIVEGGDYIVYWEFEGAKMYASFVVPPVADYPALMLQFGDESLYAVEFYPFLIEIAADGSVENLVNSSGMPALSFYSGMTYEDLYSALEKYGAIHNPFVIIGALISVYPVYGMILFVDASGGYLRLYVRNITGETVLIKGNTQTGEVSIIGYEGWPITLSSVSNSRNKYVFGDNIKHGSFLILENDTHYNPLSCKAIKEGDVITAYEFIIYRNNTFQTWRLNNDGITEQIS